MTDIHAMHQLVYYIDQVSKVGLQVVATFTSSAVTVVTRHEEYGVYDTMTVADPNKVGRWLFYELRRLNERFDPLEYLIWLKEHGGDLR